MSGNLPDRQHAVNFGALVVLVFRLNGMLTAAGDALAAPAGQTSARWRVLAAVEETPMTVAQIARAWSLARQSVQRVADVLERDGLVAYEPNPAHRRASLLRLTPDGRVALERIQAAQAEWAGAVGERVGARDLAAASRLLERVIAALEADSLPRPTAGL
jgi:DNA-binding MarR family transcriptional regulator